MTNWFIQQDSKSGFATVPSLHPDLDEFTDTRSISAFFFLLIGKSLPLRASCITASEKWQGVLRARGSQKIWCIQWWQSNVNEEDI